jgi:hypothetical protein
MNYKLVTTIGRELFGRTLRLQVAYWIAGREEPIFFEREAALGAMGLGASFQQGEVAKELSRLVRLGMLAPEHPPAGDRVGRKYFRRTDSRLWRCIDVIQDVVDESDLGDELG